MERKIRTVAILLLSGFLIAAGILSLDQHQLGPIEGHRISGFAILGSVGNIGGLSQSEMIQIESSQFHIYALFFLLGSLAVSGLSDLIHMSAQKEFDYIWLAFALGMLVLDLFTIGPFSGSGRMEGFLFKWLIIGALVLVSWKNPVSALAPGDLTAMVAVASLFQPATIIVFWALSFVISLATHLTIYRMKKKQPFLPDLFIAVLIIIGIKLVML